MAAIGNLEALTSRIAADDGFAYKEFFILYHARLLQFSYSFTHSKEVAEEIVSDVFFKNLAQEKIFARYRQSSSLFVHKHKKSVN